MKTFSFSQEERIAHLTKDGAKVESHEAFPIRWIVQAYKNRARYTVFFGNRSNPTADYTAYNLDQARVQCAAEVARLVKVCEYRESQKQIQREKQANLKASNFFALGDIVYASWGYEQTNVDFYQIVGITDKTVKFRKVSKSSTETGYMSGNCVPLKDQFSEDEIHSRRVSTHGSIPFGYKSLSRWDGRPLHYSCYA